MLTEQVSAGLDVQDIRILEVPHPLGGTDEATVLQWADEAVDTTLGLFGAPPSDPQPAPEPAEGIDAAVGYVREMVAADGGDVELIDFDGSTIRLRLVLESVECRECVMPAEFLEQVVLDKLKAALPGLVSVKIDDPRTSEKGSP